MCFAISLQSLLPPWILSLLPEPVSLSPISEGTEEHRTEVAERGSLSATAQYNGPAGMTHGSMRPESKTRLLMVPYPSPRRSIQSDLPGPPKFPPKVATGPPRDPIGYYNRTKPESSDIWTRW